MKNLLKIVLITVLALMLTPSVSAFASDDGYVLMYSNTFDNGTKDMVSKSNDYLSVTYKASNVADSEYNGNMGIGVNESAWEFETATFAFNQPQTSGKVIVSYDLSKKDLDTIKSSAIIKLNDTNYAFYMSSGMLYGPADNLGGWGDKNYYVDYELDTLYSIKLMYDLDNRKAYAFVNDEVLSTKDIPATFELSKVSFRLSMAAAYLDNIVIERYEQIPMAVSSITKTADNEVTVAFADIIDTEKLVYSGYLLKDLTTGVAYNAEIKPNGSQKLVLTLKENLADGGMYEVILPNVYGVISGQPLKQNNYLLSVGEGKYITELLFADCYGNEFTLNQVNPAEVKTIKLKFSNSVSVADVMPAMLVTDSKGNEITFTSFPKDGYMIAELEGYFMEKSAYTISLSDGLDRAYTITYNTGVGKVVVKDYVFTDINDKVITSLDTVADGDSVTLTINMVKTIPQKANMVAYTTLWNGYNLTDFDFKPIAMLEADTEKSYDFTVKIEKVSDAVLTGYVWQGMDIIIPISGEASISKNSAE